MGNTSAVPVQAEPGLAAVAAPSCHRSLRAGQHVHRSTRAGPGGIVSSERDRRAFTFPCWPGLGTLLPQHLCAKAMEKVAGPGLGNEFTVPAQVSSERDEQRVHRPAAS